MMDQTGFGSDQAALLSSYLVMKDRSSFHYAFRSEPLHSLPAGSSVDQNVDMWVSLKCLQTFLVHG